MTSSFSRRMLGALLVPAALALAPAGASAVSCDGPARAGDAGVPELLTGCGDASVAKLARALGVDRADLARIDVAQTPSGRVVRLQQEVEGVPVFNGQVALTFDDGGRLDMVQSSAIPEPELSTTPELGAAEALAIARAAAPGGTDVGAPTIELVVYPADSGPALAWHVERPTLTPAADLNSIVDARTGAVLASWDSVRDATAAGSVFDPNPVQTSGDTALADGLLPAGADSDTNTAPDAERVAVTLENLNSATALDGSYVTIFTPPAITPGIYSRTDAGTRFEAVNAYYAIDRAQTKVQELGFTDVNNRSIQVNVNVGPNDNSFYMPATESLYFGTGGVDDAEDSEVVLHEYGHSIQDNQVPGFGSGDEQGAMGEGFGDFFAAMITLDKGDSAYQAARRYCVADWDAVSYNPVDPQNPGGGCLRWIDGTDEGTGDDIGKYSNTPVEVHDDGRFWSAGMTCVFQGLGGNVGARDKVLKLVIDSHQGLVPVDDNTAFEDQIAAMIVSDQNLYGGADVGLIRQCAALRGLATLTDTDPAADKTPPDVTVAVDPASPDGADGFYAGSVKVTWTVVDKESAAATSGCGPVTIDSDTGPSGVTLTCTATSEGGVTSKSVTIKRRATTPAADTKAPKTTIDKHPPKRTRHRNTRFKFSADEDGSKFECSLDGSVFSACRSPRRFRVKAGEHSFRVRATDAAGNREDSPASFDWTVKRRQRQR